MPPKIPANSMTCPFCQKAMKPAGFALHIKAKHPEWLPQRGTEAWRKVRRCPGHKRACQICGEHLPSNEAWTQHHIDTHQHVAFKPDSVVVTTPAGPQQAVDDSHANYCPCCRLNLTPVRVAITEQQHNRVPLKLSGCPKCGLDLEPITQALRFLAQHTH